MAKLTSFIENYLKNQKISDYEGWLALYGKDAEGAFRVEKAEADTAYATARAEHGNRASALYERGLAGSGYSDYLNHAAYATRQSTLSNALRKKQETETENERGYLSYLEKAFETEKKKEEAKQKEEASLFSSLLSKNLIDEDAAITYLTTRGMEEDRARELAAESIKIQKGSKSYINQLINEAVDANMTYYTAYAYALKKGLDEQDAEEAANIAAFRVARRKPVYSQGYNYYKSN